mgnify:CR=1 FL=1
MKSLLSILSLVVFSAGAQPTTSYQDFKVENQEIIFQKVITVDSLTVTKLEDFYRSIPNVNNMEVTSGGLEFDISDITVDYAKFQFSQVGTPLIIQTGKYSGHVVAEVRGGRYRLTMKNIKLTGNIGYKMINEKDDLTTYATRNSGTQLAPDWCKPNMLGLLGQAFSDKLTFVGKDNSDW